jgi:hypothetical protein
VRAIPLAFIIITMAAAAAFASEIVQVPLPELAGHYVSNARYAPFRLERPPAIVYGVSIRITGSVTVGEYYCCCDFFGEEEGPYPCPIYLWAMLQDTVNGHPWSAANEVPDPPVSGDFDVTVPFRGIYGWPVSWDFLRGGYGTVQLEGAPPGFIVECSPTIEADATLTSATLIVNADFPIAVEKSNWGRIKSLYQ